jgi:PAS domain S-box-containing protein
MPRPINGDPSVAGAIIGDNITFKKLIENSFSGITLLNKDLEIIYRTPSAERIGGWKTADRIKNNTEELIHPSDRPGVKKLLHEVLLNPGVPLTCSFQSRHFEGHYVWLECTYTNMLHDEDIRAIICNFIDISNQKKTESLLRQTIDELSAYKYALDEADIVAITDQKGIINHVNDNFCKISKYSREELIGQDHRIINSSYHNKGFIRDLWVTIAGGKIWKGELKNKAKDGSYYWVDTTIIPFLNKEGKPYQYIAIRSDITERKLFQEKIVESGQFIKTITDSLPAMIAYWTADLHCLFANKAHLKWFDMQPNEMLGIHKQDLMDKAEFEQYKPYIQNVLKGNHQSFERSFVKKGGETIYTHTQYVPDKQDDKIKGFYSLIYDYSEVKEVEIELKKKTKQIADSRKKAELDAMAALEERNTILESIDDAFFAVDKNWIVTYWNNMAEKVLMTAKNEILNSHLWDVFPDSIDSTSYKKYHEAVKTNKAVHFEDYFVPLSKWYEISAYPSESGLSVYFKDITERKTTQAHLIELNKNLQKHAKELSVSNAELEQFAYVASHDLQEPLRMITGFLTQLEKKYGDIVDDKGKQYIHFAVDGAKRMRQIILDLLEFSRVGKSEDKLEEIDFGELIDEITALYHKQIEEQQATINIAPLPTLQGYKVQIRQVFQNLISNALKYQHAGTAPLVSISCKEFKNHWQFIVKDNGIGINPEYFDKIFIIFQRLHNKDEYSGTGMGLAVTRKIIENMGGKIWVESEEGKGCSFYFTVLKKQ